MVTGNIDMKNMVVLSPPPQACGGLEDTHRKISNRFSFNSVVYLIFNFAGSLKNLTFELSKIFMAVSNEFYHLVSKNLHLITEFFTFY